MTSKRQTLITQIKTIIEADSTVYNTTGTSLINQVLTEPTDLKINANTLTIVAGPRSGDRIDIGSNIDETLWMFTLDVQYKQIKRESNDNLFQVIENIWTLFEKNTLGSNAIDCRVTDDDPKINKDNQTILDGCEISLEVNTMEVLS